PHDRRFHAELNACPACGPRVQLVARGQTLFADEGAIAIAAEAIGNGAIVAIKGAGGFVLVTNATDEAAVDRLRRRKQRPRTPFGVMGRALSDLDGIAQLDLDARILASLPTRPIVLVPGRA